VSDQDGVDPGREREALLADAVGLSQLDLAVLDG
jgi:hypothetical protein